MNARKILFFILSVVVYCLYCVNMWYMKHDVHEEPTQVGEAEMSSEISNTKFNEKKRRIVKFKPIPLFMKDTCSILQIFSERPTVNDGQATPEVSQWSADNNTVTTIGITFILVILVLTAIFDVVKVKEEERARRKLNPDGERRQSLAEFANRKTLRRESSKFGLQLFQIAESFVSSSDEKKNRRQSRPYTRGESTSSYLSDKKAEREYSAPTSVSETQSGEPRLVKRQSVAKLFGARPVPMVRRSSFPALPLNPELQALMLGHRQTSVDSDDEGDGRGRRVRIIRRY